MFPVRGPERSDICNIAVCDGLQSSLRIPSLLREHHLQLIIAIDALYRSPGHKQVNQVALVETDTEQIKQSNR